MLGLEYIPRDREKDFEIVLEWLECLKPDFLLIPDSPNLTPSPESWVVSVLFAQRFDIDIIPSIAGSGRRRERVESALLGLKYAGISKVAMVGGDKAQSTDLTGAELTKIAKEILGKESLIVCGISLKLQDYKAKQSLEAKIANGATLFITQPVFEPSVAKRFLKDFEDVAKGSNVGVMIGFFPIYEVLLCDKLIENDLGFDIGLSYKKAIEKNPFEANLELYTKLKEICPDIHLSGAKNRFLSDFIKSMRGI